MKVCLSALPVALEGWFHVPLSATDRGDARARVGDFLHDRADMVDEVLIVGCLERFTRSEARALLEVLARELAPGTTMRIVAPDAPGVLSALDANRVDVDDVDDWFVACFGTEGDPWCCSDGSLASLLDDAGLGIGRPVPVPRWIPPGLAEWRCAREVDVGDRETGAITAEPDAVRMRLLDLVHERQQAREVVELPAVSPEPVSAASRLRALIERYLPRGGRRRAVVRAGLDAVRETHSYVDRLREITSHAGLREPRTPSYRSWARHHDASSRELEHQTELSKRARRPIMIHCVVLASTTAGHGELGHTLRSLEHQTWTHWRASVIDQRRSTLRADDRIDQIADVGSMSKLLAHVAGVGEARDLVLFLEAGDELAPDACFRIADTASTDPLVDLVYWDDDVLERGRRERPRFRPSWSPEMLLSANYIGRSFALRRRAIPLGDEPAADLGDDTWWDLLLRASPTTERVARIPRVLAHLQRRLPERGEHAEGIIGAHLARRDVAAVVRLESGSVRLAWSREEWPHVTVIVPTRHNRPMIERTLRGIERTDYENVDVIVVDNGGRTRERETWYESSFPDLSLQVEWWVDEFNYSAVNNAAARQATGEVLVFLNDDTDMPDPSWLRELVGWATQPEIGVVGLQLLDEAGLIQHGGVILGLNGFADHLFQGAEPGTETLLGSTTWYRDVLAVTAACMAIRRGLFDELNGFDERFRLCGSDVALGLDAVLAGKRNLCSPFGGVRHLESATRGSHVPPEDFFASFWRYQRWVFAGDPYFSPGLSLGSRVPELQSRFERSAADRMAEPLQRTIKVFRQSTDDGEIEKLADSCRITGGDVEAIARLHARESERFEPKTVNWFLPELDSPFYGGINTALRIADHIARVHGVENRFVLWAHPNDSFHRSAIAAAFPALADAPIYYDLSLRAQAGIPAADAAIATLWVTAYAVAHAQRTRRKFYLIQDFEPMFYPAGTMYALAEESYRLGLYGICNTDNLLRLYSSYGGTGRSFMPAVDRSVFHAEGRTERRHDDPVTVFVYARPGHWRNCWEVASLALQELKTRLGDRVRIVTAGSWARPEDVGTGIHHLGLLDYAETGNLYRTCDVGVALTVSEHPSYLPLELMASGVAVVAFDNSAGYWLLRDGENCLLARRNVDDLSNRLERLVLDARLRCALAERGLRDIDEGYGSWDKALSGIYEYLSDPES